ncbi:MAG: cytochrome bd ubiquinol oxidase subunit [Microbacteriaceae bacterium]|nr:cytochrome bd ubiquinol oxidase subunit [Microbacteriaceae bacterium]
MMVTIWFLVILLCLVMYVVLDGYDLGAGIASLFERNRHFKHEIVEVVATRWDGNETWLVLLGVALWAGFPLAFGVILPHLYLPLIVTLFALIARGASVEFISQNPQAKQAWVTLFGVSSLVAAFAQGFAIGSLTSAAPIVNGAFAGSAFGAFTPFSVLGGVTAVLVYLALGYGFLKIKSHGVMRESAARRGAAVAIAAVVAIVATLVAINATAAPLNLSTAGRAIAFWGLLLFAVAGVAMTVATFRRTTETVLADRLPFTGIVVTIVSVILAITVARYPVLLPPSLTLNEARSPDGSLIFLLVGIGLNMPLILFYNWFSHRTFGGKIVAEPHADGTATEIAVTSGSNS